MYCNALKFRALELPPPRVFKEAFLNGALSAADRPIAGRFSALITAQEVTICLK